MVGALGRVRVANTSVIAGSAFHVVGLLALHLCGRLDFMSVPLLTFATEVVVFVIRAGTVAKIYAEKRAGASAMERDLPK